MRPVDTMKRKQFLNGVSQLAQEGAIHAHEGLEVAASVHHGDVHGHTLINGFGEGALEDDFCLGLGQIPGKLAFGKLGIDGSLCRQGKNKRQQDGSKQGTHSTILR